MRGPGGPPSEWNERVSVRKLKKVLDAASLSTPKKRGPKWASY